MSVDSSAAPAFMHCACLNINFLSTEMYFFTVRLVVLINKMYKPWLLTMLLNSIISGKQKLNQQDF